MTSSPLEDDVRSAVHAHLQRATSPLLVDEFWIPLSHERADVVAVDCDLLGIEIKTSRDDLRRLPRQVSAYGRVFNRCIVVVAAGHLGRVMQDLPAWWGVLVIDDPAAPMTRMRGEGENPNVEVETLVRLLWKDEARAALLGIGAEVAPQAGRHEMWETLLATVSLAELEGIVRDALIHRDPRRARIPTRRFTGSSLPKLVDDEAKVM